MTPSRKSCLPSRFSIRPDPAHGNSLHPSLAVGRMEVVNRGAGGLLWARSTNCSDLRGHSFWKWAGGDPLAIGSPFLRINGIAPERDELLRAL